jgi:hypothetical protein
MGARKPPGTFSRNPVRKIVFGRRLSMEGGTKVSVTRVGELLLCLGVLDLWALTRASQIPRPFALHLRGSSKQNQSKTRVNKIYTRTAQPARLPGENKSYLRLARICFAPCITGVLVLDFTGT